MPPPARPLVVLAAAAAWACVWAVPAVSVEIRLTTSSSDPSNSDSDEYFEIHAYEWGGTKCTIAEHKPNKYDEVWPREGCSSAADTRKIRLEANHDDSWLCVKVELREITGEWVRLYSPKFGFMSWVDKNDDFPDMEKVDFYRPVSYKFRLHTSAAPGAATFGQNTIAAEAVDGDLCTLLSVGSVRSGELVEAAGICHFSVSELRGLRVTAAGGDSWVVDRAEHFSVPEGAWSSLFVDGDTARPGISVEAGGLPPSSSTSPLWRFPLSGPRVLSPVPAAPSVGAVRFTTAADTVPPMADAPESADTFLVSLVARSGESCMLASVTPSAGGVFTVENVCPFPMESAGRVVVETSGADVWFIGRVEVYESVTIRGVTGPAWVQWVAPALGDALVAEMSVTRSVVTEWHRQESVRLVFDYGMKKDHSTAEEIRFTIRSSSGGKCVVLRQGAPPAAVLTVDAMCPFGTVDVSSVSVDLESGSDSWEVEKVHLMQPQPLKGSCDGSDDAEVKSSTKTWVFESRTLAPVTIAPPTPAPPTGVPVTPSPPTPAPLTAAPATPVPVTPAPSTPVPVTSAPATPSPLTPTPLTPAPVTSAPPTPAPATAVPETPLPPTPAPLTAAPATPVPATPATPAPSTPGPVTSAPPTPAPVTAVPETPLPPTPAPLTAVPMPPTPVPATSVPTTPATPTSVPVTSVPATAFPATPAPPTPVPVTAAPPTPAPQTAPPATPAPLAPSPASTTAPATPAPLTPAPMTPAPPTPVSVTAAPPTPAAGTPVPATPVPPTPVSDAPPTPAPQTAAPATVSAPAPTSSLPTSAPLTAAPATAPPTPMPPTPLPPTPAPLTAAPAIPMPPTPVPATSVPLTAAPATPAPATPAPPTPIPTTPTPAKPAPPTPAPPTSAPPTPAPAAAAPPTPAPATSTPATPAPPTPTPTPATAVPETAAPPPMPLNATTTTTPAPTPHPTTPAQAEAESVAAKVGGLSVGAAAASASVASGAAAGAAMRLALASGWCSHGDERAAREKAIPPALNPTGLRVGGSAAAGTVVANLAISAGFGILCCIALRFATSAGSKCLPNLFVAGLDTQGLLRLPSAPLAIFQFFYQGITFAGMNLLFHPDDTLSAILGAAALIICLGVPAAALRSVVAGVPTHGVYATAENRRSTLLVLLLGSGEWVNTSPSTRWVQRYSSVVRTYRQETSWFFFIEFAASFALSAIASLEPFTTAGCGHTKLASAVIFLSLFLLESLVWPHARFRDSVVGVILNGLQFSSMLMMSIGYYVGESGSWFFSVASTLLIFATATLVGKIALDVVSEIFLLLSCRAEALQQSVFDREGGATPAGRRPVGVSTLETFRPACLDLTLGGALLDAGESISGSSSAEASLCATPVPVTSSLQGSFAQLSGTTPYARMSPSPRSLLACSMATPRAPSRQSLWEVPPGITRVTSFSVEGDSAAAGGGGGGGGAQAGDSPRVEWRGLPLRRGSGARRVASVHNLSFQRITSCGGEDGDAAAAEILITRAELAVPVAGRRRPSFNPRNLAATHS